VRISARIAKLRVWQFGHLWEVSSRAVVGSFLAERERWILWIPVFLGAGIVLYFELPDEPPVWLGPLWIGCALVGVWFGRGRYLALVALGFVLVAGGFEAAQVRTLLIAAPIQIGRAHV